MSICNWVREAARRKEEEEQSEAGVDKDGGKRKTERERRFRKQSRCDWQCSSCYMLDSDTASF